MRVNDEFQAPYNEYNWINVKLAYKKYKPKAHYLALYIEITIYIYTHTPVQKEIDVISQKLFSYFKGNNLRIIRCLS